tara:strand:- start:381 stop:1781 length:1401 start_codon:yes stop_codon:yes gene_type:complete
MSYKFTTGSVRKGDIYFEDDRQGEPTYIDFGLDTITLRPSGTAQLYTEHGKVGIGTTSPDHTLHVKSPGTCHVKIESEAGDEAALKIKSGGQSSAYIWQPGNTSDLRFYINGADVMHLDNDGNVGIGTTTPSQALEVAGNVRIQNNGSIYCNGTGELYLGNTNSGVIRIGGDTGTSTALSSFNHLSLQTSRDADDLYIKTGDSTTTRLTVNGATGKVGIGTTGPDRALDILDAADPQLRLTQTDGSKYVDFYANGAGDLEITGSGNNAHLRFISPQNATVVIQSQHAGDSDVSLAFSVDGGANVPFSMGVDDSDSDKFKIGAETIDIDTKMTITTSGDVGIGWTDPGSRLNISGSVQFNMTSFSANATIGSTHYTCVGNCGPGGANGSMTLTLPSATDAISGRVYVFKRADTGGSAPGGSALVVARNGAYIDGGTDNLELGNGDCISVQCVNQASGWIVLGNYVPI